MLFPHLEEKTVLYPRTHGEHLKKRKWMRKDDDEPFGTRMIDEREHAE